MKKLYGFYRPEVIGKKKLDGVSQNGTYTISFYTDGQYEPWIKAGLVSIHDEEIPTANYIKELVPGIEDGRRFVYMEYNELYIKDEVAVEVIQKIGAKFDLRLLTLTEAKNFIETHTNLEKRSEGVYLLSEATKGIDGEEIPEKLLTID